MVAVVVHPDAEEVEPLQDPPAHRGAVLADAAGEDDRVDAAHRRRVGADVLAHPVGEDREREAGAVVALLGLGLQIAHVVAQPAEALQAALAVEHALGLVDAELAGQLDHHAGIDVARAGAHHQALERGHAHGRLRGRAELDRAGAGAVAEVQGDDAQVPEIRVHVLRGEAGHELVAGAVEAEATDAVLVRELAIDRVHLRAPGHARMEGGVEDRDVGHVREQLARGADARQVGRVVQRREGHARLDGADHLVVDPGGAVEGVAAVDHSMADGLRLVGLRFLEDLLQGVLVGSPLGADALGLAFGEPLARIVLDDLPLHAR